jgi:hypothetical protein
MRTLELQGADELAIIKGPREDQTNEAKISEELVKGSGNLPTSQSPYWGASGEAVSAATYKSTSRSPTPRSA